MIALFGQVVIPLGVIEEGVVLVDGETIAAVGRAAEVQVPSGVERIEAPLIAPGFVDLQLNGAFGHDLNGDPGAVAEIAARLPATGVTTFLPTLISAPRAVLVQRLATLREGAAAARAGSARIGGFHLEGPFLSPVRVGAHETAALALPTAADAAWIAAAGVRLVTLAPELPGALELTSALIARGVAVAAGHTDATAEQAQAAIDAGVRFATHLFNAMAPLHHRAPGAAGAFLAAADAAVGLIADGVHVHPAMVQVVRRCKRIGKVVLVTDAIAAAGVQPGRSMLAGRAIVVDATSARLPDGTLAGSTLTMDAAVRNYRSFTGCEAHEAIAAATVAPASALGAEGLGCIAVGGAADLVLLGRDLRVLGTLINGVQSFRAPDPRAAPSR